jgi:hypothetical protein
MVRFWSLRGPGSKKLDFVGTEVWREALVECDDAIAFRTASRRTMPSAKSPPRVSIAIAASAAERSISIARMATKRRRISMISRPSYRYALFSTQTSSDKTIVGTTIASAS